MNVRRILTDKLQSTKEDVRTRQDVLIRTSVTICGAKLSEENLIKLFGRAIINNKVVSQAKWIWTRWSEIFVSENEALQSSPQLVSIVNVVGAEENRPLERKWVASFSENQRLINLSGAVLDAVSPSGRLLAINLRTYYQKQDRIKSDESNLENLKFSGKADMYSMVGISGIPNVISLEDHISALENEACTSPSMISGISPLTLIGCQKYNPQNTEVLRQHYCLRNCV